MAPVDGFLPQYFIGSVREEPDIRLFDPVVYKASGSGSGLVDALLEVEDGKGTSRQGPLARICVRVWNR